MSAAPISIQETLTGDALRTVVREVVEETPAFDACTGLFPLPFGRLCRWGIDEMLTTGALADEAAVATGIAPSEFAKMPQVQRADTVWETLFLNRTPLSDAALEVVAALSAFDLDGRRSNLAQARAFFDNAHPEKYLDDVLRISNLSGLAIASDPFDLNESAVWLGGGFDDPRFHAGLRLDPIFDALPATCVRLKSWGYDVSEDLKRNSIAEVRRYVDDWSQKMRAVRVQLAAPSSGVFAEGTPQFRILTEAVLPACKDRRLPILFSLKPATAGESSGRIQLGTLAGLVGQFPTVKFTIGPNSSADSDELAGLTKTIPNVSPCLDSATMRALSATIGMMGVDAKSLCSRATVFDQLIGRWKLLRVAATKTLLDRYETLADFGQPIQRGDIEGDAELLLNAGRSRLAGQL